MRLSLVPPALVLGACLAVLPACKKKGSEGGADVDITPAPQGTPAAVSSDYLLFAQLNAKSIRDSALFAEVKQAVTKAGAGAAWDKVDGDAGKEFGAKLTDIETVTVAVTELPDRGEPKLVMILTAKTPFQKAGAFGLKADAKPDARGFYKSAGFTLIHFPDDKTAVAVHPDLAQKYLDGYAKSRSGWPMTADLTRAAAGHTAFAAVNVQNLTATMPAEMKQQYAALVTARTVTVTADLKGKELSLGVRATFPDAAAATGAKDQVQSLLNMASQMIDQFVGGKAPPEAATFMPAIKEAQRAVKAAKVDASGADVTLAASYKVDFDIGQMVAEAVKKVQESGGRLTAQNNLKQIGLALLNYADANTGQLPISGTGVKGLPLRNPTDKPLLSWRVAILPYIEQDTLYKQFKLDEPWDSENNKKLIDKMPKVFAPVEKPGKPGYTHLQMVVGPNAMQPGMRFPASITDGTSNTFAVVEAADPVIWTKPDDIMMPAKLSPGALKRKFGGQFPGGFNVAMWDGSVRFVKDSVNERTLELLVNPRDGMAIPNDW